jgi:U3 small nucleolar RNA-associated protein 3
MGKKRRSTTTKASAPAAPTINAKDAKIGAVNSWKDVAGEEDEFHLQRDQVALEALSRVGGQRRHEEAELSEDEEVMGLGEYGYSGSSSDEEEEEDEGPEAGEGDETSDSEREAEEELEEGWGSSKKTYYQDAEEEYDAAEEEAEALRIQSKQLSGMSANDFAFDDEDWSAPVATSTAVTTTTTVVETLPTKLPDAPQDRLKLLHTRHPEFSPLTQEFLALQALFPALEMSAKAAETVGETEKTSAVVRKWKVASAYLGVLSMYFAILTDAGQDDDGGIDRVREHPLMSALLGVRLAWEKVKGERVERIEARLEPVSEGASSSDNDQAISRKRKHDAASSDEDSYDSEVSDSEVQVIKKLRASSIKEDFSDLDGLLTTSFPSKTSKKTKIKPANDDEDFGEESVLNDIDAEEKAKRRRNLRFYTAQITQKSSKRDAASRGAGGDADIPHRERRKERELRLRSEAQRLRDTAGADLSDGEPDAPGPKEKGKKSAAPKDDPDNEYYDLLASTAKKRKEEKLALHEAEKQAKKDGNILLLKEGAVLADGKREVGWTIMKNKGLTPHRKKENRNPRVKKKMQYDKKMKKMASVKAVYKGGQKGAYGGEATGIKKNLVKSVKFKS